MKRNDFEYVYIHANSLAEVGLEQFAEGFEDALSDQPDPLAGLTVQERKALALEQMRQAEERWDRGEADALDQASQRTAAAQPDEPAVKGSPDAESDLGAYLRNAYAAREAIAERVDAAMTKLDMVAIQTALAVLPADLPALTSPMDAAAFELWLQLYRDGHEALDEIITSIRFVDFG
jgi:hypothetical protein